MLAIINYKMFFYNLKGVCALSSRPVWLGKSWQMMLHSRLGGRNSGEKVPFLGACRRNGRSRLTGTQERTLGANMQGESAYPPPLRPTGGSLVGSLQQTGNCPNGLTGTPLISCLLVFCPFMSSLSFPIVQTHVSICPALHAASSGA